MARHVVGGELVKLQESITMNIWGERTARPPLALGVDGQLFYNNYIFLYIIYYDVGIPGYPWEMHSIHPYRPVHREKAV